jgi:hypothetical protein
MQVKDSFLNFHRRGSEDSFFEIAREDIASDPTYFGYLNTEGSWIIQRRTASTGLYEYKGGLSGFTTAWSGRAGLAYGEYNALFTAP